MKRNCFRNEITGLYRINIKVHIPFSKKTWTQVCIIDDTACSLLKWFVSTRQALRLHKFYGRLFLKLFYIFITRDLVNSDVKESFQFFS